MADLRESFGGVLVELAETLTAGGSSSGCSSLDSGGVSSGSGGSSRVSSPDLPPFYAYPPYGNGFSYFNTSPNTTRLNKTNYVDVSPKAKLNSSGSMGHTDDFLYPENLDLVRSALSVTIESEEDYPPSGCDLKGREEEGAGEGSLCQALNLWRFMYANGHRPASYCDLHIGDMVTMYCESCAAPLCSVCVLGAQHRHHDFKYLQDVAEDQAELIKKCYVSRARTTIRSFDSTCEHIRQLMSVNFRFMEEAKWGVQSAVKSIFARAESRQKELLLGVDLVARNKNSLLAAQLERLNGDRKKVRSELLSVENVLESGSYVDVLNLKKKIETLVMDMKILSRAGETFQQSLCAQREKNLFSFNPPEPALLHAVATFGSFTSGAYAPLCKAAGEGLRCATTHRAATFVVYTRDHSDQPMTVGGEYVKVVIVHSAAKNSDDVICDVEDQGNGSYKVSYEPTEAGAHYVTVKIRDQHVKGSPFKVHVRAAREVVNNNEYLRRGSSCSFGAEGAAPGQFCRPWGVCCDPDGRLIVADRSNNRVQIFEKIDDNSAKLEFLYQFGKSGTKDGEFDRPAGVACDSARRIVVADKDNHRVQIFSFGGEFLRAFGSRGNKNGQFNYPWDVAVNEARQILVSDTRNHRVQLFDGEGRFIAKFGGEGSATGGGAVTLKTFDSPRGVAFDRYGNILITDFNNHRLVVLNKTLTNAQFLGGEGGNNGQFLRPQGIAVDAEGNILIADSRNHRVQVLRADGSFLTKFGSMGSGRGQVDRPSGICVAPNGKVIVVDFGNNRLVTFQ